MKNLHAKLKNHGKKVIIHLKRHHRKYLFGALCSGILALVGMHTASTINSTFADEERSTQSIIYDQNANITYVDTEWHEFTWIWTITISNWEDSITILDRNLWATTNDINDTWSYWYHFQWWNNYGFEIWCWEGGCSDEVTQSVTSGETVDTSGYWPWNYYTWNIFRKTNSPRDWSDPQNDNLWWGSWDGEINDRWYFAENQIDRQGPCPDWYHIPSAWEWWRLLNLWVINYDAELSGNSWILPHYSGNNIWLMFSDTLKIPLAGSRGNAGKVGAPDDAILWSSSPIDRYTVVLNIHPNVVYVRKYLARGIAWSLRCFKNQTTVGSTTCDIEYSTTWLTNQDVVAYLTWCNEEISAEEAEYTFTGNWTHTFEFEDLAGNSWEATATVDRIDKVAPNCSIEYSTTWPTNQNVIATLTCEEDDITVTNNDGHMEYTFENIWTFTFEFQDLAGNTWEKEATVTRIDKIKPTCNVTYSTTWATTWNVTATLTGCSEAITWTDTQHTFTGNWTYTFRFQDLLGNTWTSDATVTWIYNDTWTNGIKSGQQMINLYNQEKAITCNIVYSWDGETGASVMYIKSWMIRQDTRTTYSWTESTMYTLARNWKMYVRWNVYWNWIWFFTSYNLSINEELKWFDDLDQYTTITCSTWVNGLSLFDIPNSIDFFNIDTYYVSTWIYFIVDTKESVKVWEYIDLTITAMKDWRRFKDYSWYILIDIVDQNWNLLNSDLYAVPSFGYYNFVVSDQWTKTFTQWLKVNKTWSYYIKVRAVEEWEWEAPIFVRWDNDPMMSWIYFSIWLDEVIKPWEYTTFTVRVLKDWLFYNNYTWTVLFTLTNKKWGLVNKKSYAIYNSWRYTFETADLWRKTFYSWLKITETWTYILEIRWLDNGGIWSRIVYVWWKHNAADFEYDTLKFNPNYSDEMNEAYQYARYFDITTKNNINYADMYSWLDRIAMAKMLSNYAENVLWISNYNTGRNCKFVDVSTSLDKKYDYWVTRACQLWIMWVNMPNNKFYPEWWVTRAEFATALSRLLYGTPDWVGQYYSTHLVKLYQEKIITNTDPTLQELRWYVMLMLKRSAGK